MPYREEPVTVRDWLFSVWHHLYPTNTQQPDTQQKDQPIDTFINMYFVYRYILPYLDTCNVHANMVYWDIGRCPVTGLALSDAYHGGHSKGTYQRLEDALVETKYHDNAHHLSALCLYLYTLYDCTTQAKGCRAYH